MRLLTEIAKQQVLGISHCKKPKKDFSSVCKSSRYNYPGVQTLS